MVRRKKSGKSPPGNRVEPRSIRFELEPDSEDLFLKHLEQFKPDKEDAEEVLQAKRGAKKTRKAVLSHELDLHGLHLDEAQSRVRERIEALREMTGVHRLKIITGKGHHSERGDSVLAKEIHSFVLTTWRHVILEIEESPDRVRVAGVPLRGHFHVTIQGRR